jgi:hypothetical protein
VVVDVSLAKIAIIVELGRNIFQAVEVANHNSGIEMIRYAIRNLPPEGISSEWVKKIWEQEHFSRNRIVFLLPPALVNLKTVVLPVLPPAQLEAAIRVEFSNSNRGEIISIIGFHLQNDMYHVKVALVKDDLLRENLYFFEEAGLRVEWSGVRARGIENFINFNQGFFDEPDEDVAYLDVTEEQTEFGVFKGDEILYRRDFTPGGSDLIELSDSEYNLDSAVIADFLEEFRLSTASYRVDFSSGIISNKLWVFGQVDRLSDLIAKLVGELDYKAFIPNKSRLTGVLTEKHTPQLAPLIGLALEATNFLQREQGRIYSEEQKQTLVKQKILLNLAKFVLIGTAILIGLILGLHAGFEKKAKQDAWLQEQASQLINLQSLEHTTKKDLQQIKELESWLSDRDRELEFLLVLQNNLPMGTKITDLIIENGSIKDLAGTTPSVSLLLEKFKQVDDLQDLRLKGTITNGPDGEIFHLEGTIIPGKNISKELK